MDAKRDQSPRMFLETLFPLSDANYVYATRKGILTKTLQHASSCKNFCEQESSDFCEH